MSVRIQEINVRNLGPIKDFNMKLGMLNLIYGKNEKGKTYLVEFLIRSLFRNIRQWRLRSTRGSGKVSIQGLEEKVVDFSPGSSLKMEDFWEENIIGLPPDFSKLLVVKGAEVELADIDGGIDKAVVKYYLSNQEILDSIEKRISNTIQRSDIQNGIIIGSNVGEIRDRRNIEKDLNNIDQLFEQINRGYSGGKRKNLADKKEYIEKKLDNIEKARRHLAYQLHLEIKDLESKKDSIDEKILQSVRENLSLYKQKLGDQKRKKETQKKSEERSLHYLWLKNVCDYYEKHLNKIPLSPSYVFLILSIFMVILAGVFTFIEVPIAVVAALAGIIVFGFLYIRKVQILSTKTAEVKELINIKKEFKKRFNKEATDIAVMKEVLHSMEEDYNTNMILKKQLIDDLRELENIKLKISDQFYELIRERKEPKLWNSIIIDLEARLREFRSQIEEKRIQLAELGVDSSDYFTKKPEVEYSKQQYNELREKLEKTDRQIEEENQKLTTLKQLICQQTDNDIAINWEVLIYNLREKRNKLLKDYKQKTAEILGKIAVYKVSTGLRREEDTKIIEVLRSKTVASPLNLITKRYMKLDLEGENLIVSDPYQDFYISDLSTGALEQVLMALRIGFSMKILKQKSLFLILDDAFQYSDWERREWLLEMMIELVKNEWQILYFTMDNHIRSLFDEKCKVFGEQYKTTELSN